MLKHKPVAKKKIVTLHCDNLGCNDKRIVNSTKCIKCFIRRRNRNNNSVLVPLTTFHKGFEVVKLRGKFKYVVVLEFLEKSNLAYKKEDICKATKLSLSTVKYALYKLKKLKKVGVHRHKYWSVNFARKQ